MLKRFVSRASFPICLWLWVLLFPLPGNGGSTAFPLERAQGEAISSPYGASGFEGIVKVELANGISAEIFTSEYLEKRTVPKNGERGIELADGRYLSVITDINDPQIINKGDGEFHPFRIANVVEALREISYPGLDLKLTIYILPYPRRNVLASSTSGTEIFLSPHVRDIPEKSGAYITTHETGHAFQHEFLPRSSVSGWKEYKSVRSIDDDRIFSDLASHAYRPEEIFAEDFRVLFGGEKARFGGTIENPDIPSPLNVEGLKEFYISLAGRAGETSLLAISNYPNPFNPETEISLRISREFLASGKEIHAAIYDVRGALVKELYRGIPERATLFFPWDGKNDKGKEVASSVYFCTVRFGSYVKTRKLLMVK